MSQPPMMPPQAPSPPFPPPPPGPPMPPPYGYGPPPMSFYPPPAAKGRSLGAALFTGLMVTLLGCSLTLNFWLLVAGGLMALAGSGTEVVKKTTLVEGNASSLVYEIDVKGIIDETTQERFEKLIKEAAKDTSLKALIVHIDTPGGTVTASDEIYNLLKRFKEKKNLPIVITQGGLATSGGYYISAAGDHVLANRTTLTGNIGVIMQRFNVSKLMEKWGVDDATIVSSGATYKDAGSMFKPENERDRAYLQNLMDQAFVTFKDVVAKGRGSDLKQPIDAIANGKVYTATEAEALGLIDEIGDRESALAYLAKNHAVNSPQVVKLDELPTFGSLFSVVSSLKGGEAKLDVSKAAVELFATPRPLYLWRGE